MAFLGVLVALAARLTGLARRVSEPLPCAAFSFATGMAYVQIIVGAVVRHTGAALACPDVPWCAGRAWPGEPLARLQMIHRALACAVFLAVLAASVLSLAARRGRRSRRFALFASAPLLLVLVQGTLGVAVVATGAVLPVITLHHATGALLLASLVLARMTA
jgi:cytochrome c oxidase assembly protein subunit 15